MRERPRVTEIASAAAVVLSLIFVGLEVRESARQTAQNTQSLQVGAYQDLMSEIMAYNMLSMENPTANAASSKSSIASLSPGEFERESARSLFFLRYGDLAFYQYELGMLSAERLESALGPINDQICSPLLREFWLNFRDNFVPNYRAYMDDKLSSRAEC